MQLLAMDAEEEGQEFAYDRVWGDDSTQEEVYEYIGVPILESAMDGFNSTIFAYGQTGSGKTWSLMGNAENPGITPSCCIGIFKLIAEEKKNNYRVRVSYLELYNEELKDLLNPDGGPLKIIDDKKMGPIVKGLTDWVVKNPDEISAKIEKGEGNRSYGYTDMNANSSRSHVIFKMLIESRPVKDGETGGNLVMDWGKIKKEPAIAAVHLVDLAGSERQGKTNATGSRLKEGININKSLTCLGLVINKLVEGGKGHIPFRDSKLTRMLQSSLGGNARTAMMCAISPAERNKEETLSTLAYASRAKKIVNTATKNEAQPENQMKMAQMQQELAASHEREMEEMRRQLIEQQNNAGAVEAQREAQEQVKAMQNLMLVAAMEETQALAAGDHKRASEIKKKKMDVMMGRRAAKDVLTEVGGDDLETKILHIEVMTAHNQAAASEDPKVVEQLEEKKAVVESKKAEVEAATKELEAASADDPDARAAIEARVQKVKDELQEQEQAFEKLKTESSTGAQTPDPTLAEQFAAANAALDFDFDSMLQKEEGAVETMAKNHGTRSARKVVQQWFINTFSSALNTWRSKSAHMAQTECKKGRSTLKAQTSQIETQASRIRDMEEHAKTLEHTNLTVNERLKYVETMFTQTRTEMHDARKQLVAQTQRADGLEEDLNHTTQTKDLALEEFEQINKIMAKIQEENIQNRREKGRLSEELLSARDQDEKTYSRMQAHLEAVLSELALKARENLVVHQELALLSSQLRESQDVTAVLEHAAEDLRAEVQNTRVRAEEDIDHLQSRIADMHQEMRNAAIEAQAKLDLATEIAAKEKAELASLLSQRDQAYVLLQEEYRNVERKQQKLESDLDAMEKRVQGEHVSRQQEAAKARRELVLASESLRLAEAHSGELASEILQLKREAGNCEEETSRSASIWLREESELRQRLLEAQNAAADDKQHLVAQITTLTDQLAAQQEALRDVGGEKKDTERMLRELRNERDSDLRIHVQQIEQLKTENTRTDQLLARATSDMQTAREKSNKILLSHREEVSAIRADLDAERAKNGQVGQQNAKLTIEVETLARQVERKDIEIETAMQIEQDAKNETLQKVDEISQLRLELSTSERGNEALSIKVEELNQTVQNDQARFNTIQKDLQESMQNASEVARHRDAAHDEAAKLREAESIVLAERDALSASLLKLEADLSEERSRGARVKDSKVQTLKAELAALRLENDGLQASLEAVSKRREEEDFQRREAASELLDYKAKLERLEAERSAGMDVQEQLQDEKEDLRKRLDDERMTSIARQQALQAAEKQVELGQVTRDTLEGQLTEMNEAYARALADKRALEGQVTKWRREAHHAEEMAGEAQELAKLSGKTQEEAENSERLAVEVQALRGQLTSLRKKMAESHLDAFGESPEDSSGANHVYESVIARLKQELIEEGAERRVLQQKLSEALRQASKAQSLEEEMDLLGRSSRRTQDGLAESTRLASKLKEDMLLLQTEKDTTERLLEKSTEAQRALEQRAVRLQEQIATERKRSDAMTHECARAERFAAEASTMRTKAEGQLVGVAEKNRQFELERSHFKNLENSHQQKVTNSQREYAALTAQHAEVKRQLGDTRLKYDELMAKNAQMESTHQSLKQHAGRLEEEQRHDIARYRERLQESEEEVSTLYKQLLDSENKCERVRLETSDLAAAQAGKQIEELRGELSSTMSQWTEAEAMRRRQEDTSSKMRTVAQKEKERAALYKAQVSLLEDQLRAASEELEVFRQLDVYKATLQREFETVRHSRSAPSGAESRGNRDAPPLRNTGEAKGENEADIPYESGLLLSPQGSPPATPAPAWFTMGELDSKSVVGEVGGGLETNFRRPSRGDLREAIDSALEK